MGKYFKKDGTEITEAECNTMKDSGVLFSNRGGDRYEFSDVKKAKRDAQVAEDIVNEPMKNWTAVMKKSDLKIMPRHMEDLITDNPDFNIHEKMKTHYDEKVALRATKP